MRLTKPLLLLLPLVIISFVYWPVLGFDFAWLDQFEIIDRGLIIESFGDFFSIIFSDDGNYPGYHRPLYNAIHSLDLMVWGKDPMGFHLSSLFLHLVNVALLTILLRNWGLDKWLVLSIVLVWGLAPLNAATVAPIHSKADLLSTTFVFLGLHFIQKEGWHRSVVLATIAFILAVLSKEVALAGVLLAGLFLYSRGVGRDARWFSILAPLVVIIITKMSSAGDSFSQTGEYFWRLLTFPLVYGSYFFESMTGARLSVSDAVWSVNGREVINVILYLGMAISAIILQYLLWRRVPSARPFILVFNLFLLPVSQIIPTLHFRADRFLYVASAGWWGMWLTTWFSFVKSPVLQRAVPMAVALGLGIGLYTYLPVFENDETLFGYTVEKFPECREANAYLGMIALEEKNYSASLGYFSIALNNNPDLFSYVDRMTVRANMATVRMRNGQYRDALDMLLKVEEERGPSPSLDLNIGICYKMLGDPEKAFQYIASFQKVYPDDLKGMEKMAEVYIDLGRKNMAIEEFNRILRLYPAHPNREGINAAVQALKEAR